MELLIDLPHVTDGAPIPARFTCDGENISPPLKWRGIPAQTRSLALVVDDPDAPAPGAAQHPWVHWILYNIPRELPGLPEGVESHALPPGAHAGLNDWQRTGYDGPCPPRGLHHFRFKIYALDTPLGHLHAPNGRTFEKAISGHVIDHAESVYIYRRGRVSG